MARGHLPNYGEPLERPGGTVARFSVRVGVLALMLVAAGCAGDEQDGSPTPAATGATGAITTTGVPAESPASTTGVMPLAAGPLEPGSYTFDGFSEPISFTVSEGWEALLQEPEESQTALGVFFALFNEDHPAANLAFLQSTRVVDPGKDWDEEGNLIPAPDFIAFMADHPMHDAGEPFATTIGTVRARAVDLVVTEVPRNGWPSCGGQCVLWFPIAVDQEDGPLDENDLVFGGAFKEHDRQIAVEIGGQQLLVDIGAINARSFEAFLPLAEEILATIRFG
jgi:hypothetical protein